MIRILAVLVTLGLLTQGASAQGFRLFSMNSLEDGRDWNAVGRLELAGKAFCTGALIDESTVLTAAHCLYDSATGQQIDPSEIQFLAGWRNGRASAYRRVRAAVHHPDYTFADKANAKRVRNDVALLELQHPIRNTTIVPFDTGASPRVGDELGVVSYAHDRSEAPSLQETCDLLARQNGALIMSCDVDFGASGSPVFRVIDGAPRIVSVVSGKAMVSGRKVSLGTALTEPLALLRVQLASSRAFKQVSSTNAPKPLAERGAGGAKFIRP